MQEQDKIEDVSLDEAQAAPEVDGEKVADDAGKEIKKSAPKQVAAPKTKVGMINAMADAMKGMKKDELQAMYKRAMGEEVEQEETTATSIKEIKQISAEDVDISEDVSAMFAGQDLSEEFADKATTIFEAAVVSKVNEILESVTVDLEADLEAEKMDIQESLSTKLDDYLEYVVEEWMQENELAVESSVRSEIVENFMVGLRDLFTENYIDIPEEKVDLVDELAGKVAELEESVNVEMEKTISLRKELAESKKQAVFTSVCEGLTESQVVKLKSLAEGVDFESEDDYAEKLDTLKENYFPAEELITEDTSVDEEPLELTEEAEEKVDPGMAAYMDAITRSLKK